MPSTRAAARSSPPGPEHAFCADYCRNGQERCHSTNKLIPRGALRLGVVIQSQWGQRGTLWHLPEPFFSRGHQGLVSAALIHNFENLREVDRARIQRLVDESLDDAAGWARRNATAVTRAGPPASVRRDALLLAIVAALLLLCEYVFPWLEALERGGKAARLRGWRRLYVAVNYARTAQLRLRWRCCRRRPSFGASEVAPGLFIGSMADAHNLEALQARGIVAVVTVSPGIPPPFASADCGSIRYLCLDVIDLPDEPLTGHFCTVDFTCHRSATLNNSSLIFCAVCLIQTPQLHL
jgi:hypothetical protein